MANTFIAVEGPHDVELICGLLEPLGFTKVVMADELDDVFGHRLITKNFPYLGDLHRRVPNPMFLQKDDDWVAVRAAGGETPELLGIVRNAMNSLSAFPGAISAIGVFRDADELGASERFDQFSEEFAEITLVANYALQLPARSGDIADGNPRLGIYIIPDNVADGALEDLLLDCGNVVYPGLISGAQTYVDGVDLALLNKKDKSLFKKPNGKKKAVVACAADILKPGMSIATSIDQNRWLCEDSRKLPRIAAITEFLKQLCGLS